MQRREKRSNNSNPAVGSRKRRTSSRLQERNESMIKSPCGAFCDIHRLYSHNCKDKTAANAASERGAFASLPPEVIFAIFSFLPLQAMSYMTLASKNLRDLTLVYVYSKSGIRRVVPHVDSVPDDADIDSPEYKNGSQKCYQHYKALGVMIKRATFLFTTKIRLSHVVKVLGHLKDSHKKICLELGGDLAFSCYGVFFHAFIAGWEDYEKIRAFEVIKDVSLLNDRIHQVMTGPYGSTPKYERYIRVVCREIFLNRSSDADKAFWLAQILKRFPMCIQSRLLYLIYGPVDEENDYVAWERCVVSTDGNSSDLMNLARGFQYMLNDARRLWSVDDLIGLFDEITTVSAEWDVENVAIFLKFCGTEMCQEVLGNKLVNNRTSELSYLLYYIWQYCSRAIQTDMQIRREQDWFISLIHHISKRCSKGKGALDVVKQMFVFWEECMMDSVEDQTGMTDSQQSLHEDERAWFRESLQSLTSLTTLLLSAVMKEK